MNDYIVILKVLLNADNRKQFLSTINENFLKENQPDLYRIFQVIRAFPETQNATLHDLALAFYTAYPQAKRPIYDELLNAIHNCRYDSGEVQRLLTIQKQREIALDIAKKSLAFSEGSTTEITSICELAAHLQSMDTSPNQPETSCFVSNDISSIFHEENLSEGLKWPLNSLNEVLGPLRQGDFGFVFARPETGKTTFLVHTVTHMATQASRPILWFNNEEKGTRVMKRCYQAMFGINLVNLYSQLPKYEKEFKEKTRERICIYDDARITRRTVEELCRQHNPSLIIFDQIDKIEGFDGERYDLMLKRLYQWARELAKKYGPVIAVCQAGGTGENKKWLQMNDVDSSHTAKQGEADWVLGIGRVDKDGFEDIRYMHVSKNKLAGDPNLTKEERRHDKWECLIRPEIGQYADY